MKKLKCIIVDDEPVARKIIREFVMQIHYLELSGEFENALKAEVFLKQPIVGMSLIVKNMLKFYFECAGLILIHRRSHQPIKGVCMRQRIGDYLPYNDLIKPLLSNSAMKLESANSSGL